MKTISATSATWRSTATVSCVPRVTDYGRPDGSYTATNGPEPNTTDRIRPIKRRRHRGPRRRPVLPVKSYL